MLIIASGAGGGTLARQLAPSGKSLLILERGDWLKREAVNWVLHRGLALFPAASAVFTSPTGYAFSATRYGLMFVPQASILYIQEVIHTTSGSPFFRSRDLSADMKRGRVIAAKGSLAPTTSRHPAKHHRRAKDLGDVFRVWLRRFLFPR